MTREDAVRFLCEENDVDYVAILSQGKKINIYKDGKPVNHRGITKLDFTITAGKPYETTITRTHLHTRDLVCGDT